VTVERVGTPKEPPRKAPRPQRHGRAARRDRSSGPRPSRPRPRSNDS
jgi:hypothetical protein